MRSLPAASGKFKGTFSPGSIRSCNLIKKKASPPKTTLQPSPLPLGLRHVIKWPEPGRNPRKTTEEAAHARTWGEGNHRVSLCSLTHSQDVVCCQLPTGSAWQLVLCFQTGQTRTTFRRRIGSCDFSQEMLTIQPGSDTHIGATHWPSYASLLIEVSCQTLTHITVSSYLYHRFTDTSDAQLSTTSNIPTTVTQIYHSAPSQEPVTSDKPCM